MLRVYFAPRAVLAVHRVYCVRIDCPPREIALAAAAEHGPALEHAAREPGVGVHRQDVENNFEVVLAAEAGYGEGLSSSSWC